MKKIFLFLCGGLFLLSCTPPIKIVSSVKQTIIPGRPNVKEYSNYVVKFSLDKDINVAIDSIQVVEEKISYTTNFSLKKMGSAVGLKSIREKGVYVMEVPLRGQNIITSKTESTGQDKLTVFFTENNKAQQIEITEFEKKKVTKRTKRPK